MSFKKIKVKDIIEKKKDVGFFVDIAINNAKEWMDDFDTFEILNVGGLIKAQAYYHETDEHYTIIGLAIEYKTEFIKNGSDVGLFPIYYGYSSRTAPISFEETYSRKNDDIFNVNKFTNGCGDFAETMDTLYTKEETQEYFKNTL